MATKQSNKKTRSLREFNEETVQQLPRKHRKFLLALLEAAICKGTPFYVSRTYKSGRIAFKFYTEDEVLDSFIEPSDDPAIAVELVADQLYGPRMAKEVLEQGASLEAQEALRAAKRPPANP